MTPSFLLPVPPVLNLTREHPPTDFCAECRTPLYLGEDHWTDGEPLCFAHCPECSGEGEPT